MKRGVKYFYFIIISLFVITGCKNSSDNKIYKPERRWTYIAVEYNNDRKIIDSITLVLKVENSWWYENLIGQTRIQWIYKKGDSIIASEKTGVVDGEKTVEIHPPREMFLNFTEILPFPASGNPGYLLYESNSELVITKYPDYRDGILEGKTITQHLMAIDTTLYDFNKKKYICWLLTGENTNYIEDLGQFKCKYLFNEILGFVNLTYYKPDSSMVEIRMKSVNF